LESKNSWPIRWPIRVQLKKSFNTGLSPKRERKTLSVWSVSFAIPKSKIRPQFVVWSKTNQAHTENPAPALIEPRSMLFIWRYCPPPLESAAVVNAAHWAPCQGPDAGYAGFPLELRLPSNLVASSRGDSESNTNHATRPVFGGPMGKGAVRQGTIIFERSMVEMRCRDLAGKQWCLKVHAVSFFHDFHKLALSRSLSSLINGLYDTCWMVGSVVNGVHIAG
jgi:hypothetical protein